MSIPNDYQELLGTVAELTDKGRVNWKFDGHAVEVLLEEDRFVIWAGTDERTDEGFVSFALKDKRGETLDSWYLDAGDEQYDFMNRLFLSAKRHALGIPDRLARIRDLLSKDGIVGKNEA
jgi:hypothetical protein